ncbi:EF-hand domain-containing protein [Paracoccus saliphilus]|uniref:Ca2+-binding protein, EF-hand superfamily n=1 Tax=Paracoccus saliphilus TaxID=405559 RepID=A0AA45W8Q6_9RHOB|nr:EF-hand domain-containing protein [Paracoccus saliphilus]WCR02651.1 EF-hand domain-containing protein [Paracoccus saliphilus]SIT18484.1 Ca2+-binding protein, EF-hand superfamily [Paracoccus saliphilus]
MTRTPSLTLSVAVLLAGFGAFATPALAQSQDAETNQKVDMFERFDANGDGAITREEMEQAQAAAKEKRDTRRSKKHERKGGERGAGAKAAFEQADSDGDGALSRSELLARNEARVDKMIERFDADEDGALSPEEMREGVGKRHRGHQRGN